MRCAAVAAATAARYDEPGLLQEVEKRLGASIPSLAEDLSLPPELQARLAGGAVSCVVMFGGVLDDCPLCVDMVYVYIGCLTGSSRNWCRLLCWLLFGRVQQTWLYAAERG